MPQSSYTVIKSNNDGVVSFLVKLPGPLSSNMVRDPITVLVLNVMMNLDLNNVMYRQLCAISVANYS